MSGHNRWAKVKHVKAKTDAIKGKVFTKLIKDLVMAAKNGGDPSLNAALRTAMQKAKDCNMPSDTIKKSIMRGTGELPGLTYEELMYEVYGPAGTALLVQVLTTNKNKAIADIRYIIDRNGGKIAAQGSVAYKFKMASVLTVDKAKTNEDQLMGIVLDAGAEDIKDIGDEFEITGEPGKLEAIKEALGKAGLETTSAEVTKIPDTYVMLTGDDAAKMIKLVDALEEYEDVQNLYSNYDIDEKTMEALA